MKTKTNCKAGGAGGSDGSDGRLSSNHSETLVRDNGKRLKVKTALRAGKKSV